MKITKLTGDGLGVSALLAAAGAVSDLLTDRGVGLGVVLVDGKETLIAYSPREAGASTLGVTVEPNPSVLWVEADTLAEEAPVDSKPKRSGSPCPKPDGSHYFGSGAARHCMCTLLCCNSKLGACTCLTCQDDGHDHA